MLMLYVRNEDDESEYFMIEYDDEIDDEDELFLTIRLDSGIKRIKVNTNEFLAKVKLLSRILEKE